MGQQRLWLYNVKATLNVERADKHTRQHNVAISHAYLEIHEQIGGIRVSEQINRHSGNQLESVAVRGSSGGRKNS